MLGQVETAKSKETNQRGIYKLDRYLRFRCRESERQLRWKIQLNRSSTGAFNSLAS